MKQLGDITKIHGGQIEPVDVITFGSPCQDLSVAGKRAGLAGDRSGLFMEAVRIIKEMRESTNGIYPNFAVWENVPGAFSSNKGEDFRAVLEELVRIQEPNTTIPQPPKRKWNTSGAIVGNRWSLAWRVLDAQFWGVPQRRRRIALVMDFAGRAAPEILFERKGMSRHSAPCRKAWKRTARNIKKSVGGTGVKCLTPWDCQSKRIFDVNGTYPTLQAMDSGGANNTAVIIPTYCIQGSMIGRADKNGPQGNGIAICEPQIYDARGNGDGRVAPTMTGDHQNRVTDYTGIVCMATQQGGAEIMEDKCPTLTASAGMSGNNQPVVCLANQAIGEYKQAICASALKQRDYKDATDLICEQVAGVDCRNLTESQELYPTMQAKNQGGWSLNYSHAVRIRYRVRRLTPLECERLQGYPDGWTNIPDYIDGKGKKKTASDSARYKALGNSIALPPWKWVLKRISAQFERDANLGSLFDGIGGFPLIWEQLNGKGSARWASEIEPFPIAVTKYRFDSE